MGYNRSGKQRTGRLKRAKRHYKQLARKAEAKEPAAKPAETAATNKGS